MLILPILRTNSYSPMSDTVQSPTQTRQLDIIVDSSNWPIFKPQPIFSTDSLEQCSTYQNSYIFPFKILDVGYVALSLKSCGITIYNIQDPANPQVELRSILTSEQGQVNQISMDNYRNLLWITHSSGNLFSFDLLKQPLFSSYMTIRTQDNKVPFFLTFIPGVNDVFLVVCFSEIQIFSISDSDKQNVEAQKDLSLFKFYRSIQLGNSNDIIKAQFTSSLDLLFIGSYPLGVQIYQTESINTKDLNLNLIYTIKPHWSNLAWFDFLAISQRIFLQMQYGGLFEFDIKQCLSQKDFPSCSSTPLLNYYYISSKYGQFYVDKDETFLFTQFRSVGAKILDIHQGTIKVFQTLDVYGDTQSLSLNDDQSLLFYSSLSNFFIFQKTNNKIDYNKPNILLNMIQSFEYTKYKEDSNQDGPDPCCFFDEKRNVYYACRQQFGFSIFEIKAPGIIKEMKQLDADVDGQQIRNIYFFEDNTIAYIPKYNNGLCIMDFSSPFEPVIIKEYITFGVQFPQFTIIECSTKSEICAISSSYTGILFIDTSNVRDPKLVSIFNSQTIDNSLPNEWGSFMNNKKVYIAAIYTYGLLVIDLTDVSKPIEISTLFTYDTSQAMQYINSFIPLLFLSSTHYYLSFNIYFESYYDIFLFFYKLWFYIQQYFCILYHKKQCQQVQKRIFSQFNSPKKTAHIYILLYIIIYWILFLILGLNFIIQQRITSDDKYCLLTNFFQGLLVIDLSNLNKLELISTVQLFGSAFKVKLIHNEEYALVTSYENSGLFLIDITNKNQPFLSQTFKTKQYYDSFFEVCLDSQENEGFISKRFGVQLINLQNQVTIHIEIYELLSIEGTGQKQFNNLNFQSPLQVGQNINLYIIPIYEVLDISVKKAMIYSDYILQPLKPWMTFYSEQNMLNLNILNDALKQDSSGQYVETIQTIVFQIHRTLTSNCFTSQYLSITELMSQQIIKLCQSQGIIDEVMMAGEDFNPNIDLDINLVGIFDGTTLLDEEKMSDIQRSIIYVIQHSIVFYSVDFIVAQSLIFKQPDNNEDFIFSLTDQVTIYISTKVIGIKGFVTQNYIGVLCVFSQQQDEIKIEGDRNKVNQVLKQKIKFSSLQTQTDQLVFVVQVQDGLNYPITQEVSYKDAQFISEQEKVTVNKNSSLQEDFESRISEAQITINERFQYQISSDLFIGDQNTQLFFSVQMKDNDDTYNDIPLNHWLQFSQADRVFSGMPSQKDFNTVIQLRMNVTDNYSYATQELTIYVSLVPLIYIIQIVVQIIGPVIGLIGVWKYKFYLINFLYQKQYTYSKEFAHVGQNYAKQILLNNSNLIKAQSLLECFKLLVPKKEIIKQIYELYSHKMKIKSNNLKHYEVELSNSLNLERDCSPREHYFSDERTLDNKSIYTLINSQNHSILNTEKHQKDYQINNIITLRDEILEYEEKQSDSKQNDQKNLQKYSQKPLFNHDTFQLQTEQLQTQTQGMLLTQGQGGSPQNVLFSSVVKEKPFQKVGRQVINKINVKRQHSSSKKCDDDDNFSPKTRTFSLFQRNINKKMENQIQKINKFSIDASQIEREKLAEKLNDKTKPNKQQEFQLRLFNQTGEIEYENIIEYIIQQYKQGKVKQMTKIFENLINKIQDKQNLIRQTLQSFIAMYILQQDSFSYHLFQKIFKKQYYPNKTPDWYKSFCIISPNLEEIQYNPLPVITFKNEEIIKSIKASLFDSEIQVLDIITFDQIPISLPLLQETIKGCALGFISDYSFLKKHFSGESMKIKSNQIKLITSFNIRKIKDKLGKKKCILQKVNQKISRQYILKPLIDNYKLPSWIKSVDIINENLLIIGEPERKDIGNYHIFIFSDKNYILRQFEIQVVDFRESLNKSNELATASLLSSKKHFNNQIFERIDYQNEVVKQRQQENTNNDNKSSLSEEKKPHINDFTY